MHWNNSSGVIVFLALFRLTSACATEATAPFIHLKKYVMGTVFEIVAYDASIKHASTAINDAFKEIFRLDHVMSNYIPDSNLSRLNRSGRFHAEGVPRDLYEVIQESLRYSRLSGGEFDVTVGPLVNLWRSVGRLGHTPSQLEIEKLRRCVGYEKIELIPPDRIQLRSHCTELDLGAIGKGYAVDRAVAVLRSYGIRRALINAGGSTIYAMGSPPGQPAWLVHLRDPSKELDPQVMLQDSSVSTSEQTRPSLLGEKASGHIIDLAKGEPLESAGAVSVVATTATASDALSTIMLLMGPEKGGELAKRLPAVAVIWIPATGESETVSTGPQILVHRSPSRSN